MYLKNQVIRTSADFDNAMYFGIPLTIWQDGHIIDYGGTIEKNTAGAVFINGGYYLKANCEFRVRETPR